jgi:hypothetical protein
VELLPSGKKAELEIEGLRRTLAAAKARQERPSIRAGADVSDEELQGTATEAHALKSGVDHQAPEEVEVGLPRLGPEVLIVEHQEAHRRLVGVDRAEPRLRMEVSLGNGLRVAGNEWALSVRDGEGENALEVLGGDLAERDPGMA